MQFINHTPFPALAFEGIDQHDQRFHVVVLRQTLTWDETGQLRFAAEQAPLCEVDQTFDGSLHGCVRQESDLCHFKPRCDVIVNADAHAPIGPGGRPSARFPVRLMVKRPDTPAPLPPPPEGLNPWMRPSSEAMIRWQAEVDSARNRWMPGARLIDKVLQVTGPRDFVRDSAFQRGVDGTVRLASLGMLRPSAWRLTEPSPQKIVPLRLDRAFGGQCRVDADSPVADKVPARHRLTAAQRSAYSDNPQPPVAHDCFAGNPLGQGYASDWYLSATGSENVAAPQVEQLRNPVTLHDFNAARAGRLAMDADLVAGLGVRPKGHPARARLVGVVDQAFVGSTDALPVDFDFAVWNAAWPDQQVDALLGDEVIGLQNLCAADTPGAWRDGTGNVLLRLSLPGQTVRLVVRLTSGDMFLHPARLDTLVIEPEQRQVSAVWRCVLSKTADEPVRVLEAWALDATRSAALSRQLSSVGQLLDHAIRDKRTEFSYG